MSIFQNTFYCRSEISYSTKWLSSNVCSEEFSLYIMLIIVILKNRSTPETENFQFSVSRYQAFENLLNWSQHNRASKRFVGVGNVRANLHGPAYGISMIVLYIQCKHRLPRVYFVLQLRELSFILKRYFGNLIDKANFESFCNFRVEALRTQQMFLLIFFRLQTAIITI